MNELQKRAWYHKKHQKGLPSPWLTPDSKKVNKDAGDVEKGIEHFNTVSGANSDNGGEASTCAVGESVNGKDDKPRYTGKPSKDKVDKISVGGIEFPTDDEAYEYIEERDVKESMSRKQIIEGLKKLDMYCIDSGLHYLDLRGLYESLEEDLSSESKDELADLLRSKAGEDADLVSSAVAILNTKDEHPGQDLAEIQEDFDDGVCENTNKLIDMIENDIVDAKEIAIAFCKWCSEDDIAEFMRVYELDDDFE